MEMSNWLFDRVYRGSMRAKGIVYEKTLDELMKSQFHSSQELESIQLMKLRKILSHAREKVPHYQESLKYKCDVTTINDIQKFPFLTKDILKNQSERMLSVERPQSLLKKTTSGSTGEPFTVWKNNTALANELANTWRGYSWAKIHPGERHCRFWGRPLTTSQLIKSKLVDVICNRKRISAFCYDHDDFQRHTMQLIRYKPQYFYGYVSSLVAYARYIQKSFTQSPFVLKGIVTTAEILTASDRKLLESTFNTRVFDEYGCAEFGTIAHQCEEGSLHVATENLLLEVVDGNRVCRAGETGEFVITDLSNYAMPLIRYRTGDLGSISPKSCACGRQLMVIEGVNGRVLDMIERKDGKMFNAGFLIYIFDDAFERGLGISHYKIYQTDYHSFVVHVVPNSCYSPATEDFIREEVRRVFDPDAKMEFIKVEAIGRERSGKLRQVVGMKQSRGAPVRELERELEV